MKKTTSLRSGTFVWLDRSQLRPGDVVLMRGTGKDSRHIAWATDGVWSHAAIVVAAGLLFESDEHGVGYTALPFEMYDDGNGCVRTLHPLTDVEDAMVIRHEALASRSPADVEYDLTVAIDALAVYGKEYPDPLALVPAVPSLPKRLVARCALYLKSLVMRSSAINPGPYCSQLVQQVLSQVLGQTRASNIDPNRLATLGDMQAVTNVIVKDPGKRAGRRSPPTPTRDETTGQFTAAMRNATRASNAIDRVMAMCRR